MSDRVDLIHNTTFGNGRVVGYPEMFAANSKDVRIMNNVMIPREGGKANLKDSRSEVVFDYNVYAGGTVEMKGPKDVVADPKLRAPGLGAAPKDFLPLADSPAIDSASAAASAKEDFFGLGRPIGAAADRGAFEQRPTTPDAGADAAGDGEVVDDASVADAAVADAAVVVDDAASNAGAGVDDAGDGACGCQAPGRDASPNARVALLLALLLVARRARSIGRRCSACAIS